MYLTVHGIHSNIKDKRYEIRAAAATAATKKRTGKINKFNRNQKRIGCAAPSIRFNYLSILFRLQTENIMSGIVIELHQIEYERESIASAYHYLYVSNKETIVVMQYRHSLYLHCFTVWVSVSTCMFCFNALISNIIH